MPTLRKTGSYGLPKPELPLQADFLGLLPADVLGISPKTRDRAMNYALQISRLCGGAGQEYIRDMFVQCCRIISSPSGSNPLPPHAAIEAESHALVADFANSACTKDENHRISSYKLWQAFNQYCVEAKGMPPHAVPSCIRFSRALRTLPGVRLLQKRPTTIFAGLRPL